MRLAIRGDDMAASYSISVDGVKRTLQVDDANMPLLYALRDELGLNNPRFGCGQGQCGACTVLLDGQSVKSCTVLAVQADGNGVWRLTIAQAQWADWATGAHGLSEGVLQLHVQAVDQLLKPVKAYGFVHAAGIQIVQPLRVLDFLGVKTTLASVAAWPAARSPTSRPAGSCCPGSASTRPARRSRMGGSCRR